MRQRSTEASAGHVVMLDAPAGLLEALDLGAELMTAAGELGEDEHLGQTPGGYTPTPPPGSLEERGPD